MRSWSGRLVALAVFLALSLCPPALACPFCDGGPAGDNRVKVAIFGEEFWTSLFATASPFALVLAVTALLHFGLSAHSKTSAEGASDVRAH